VFAADQMRFLLFSTAFVLTGSVLAIADVARQNECGDGVTWLGVAGWTLLVAGSLATAVSLIRQLRARRWLALVPATLAALAVAAAVGAALIAHSLDSLCGFEMQL
jgi:hypothetical protein